MKLQTLFSLGLVLSGASICSAKPSRTSANKTMGTFTYAVAKKNPQLLLTLLSRSKGYRSYNTLWEQPKPDGTVTYSELANDFKRKGNYYRFFFVGRQPDDDPGVTMYDVVKESNGRKWVLSKGNEFHPPAVKDGVDKRQIFVRWTKERNSWVISAIGTPKS